MDPRAFTAPYSRLQTANKPRIVGERWCGGCGENRVPRTRKSGRDGLRRQREWVRVEVPGPGETSWAASAWCSAGSGLRP
jgi:hypothetical protein